MPPCGSGFTDILLDDPGRRRNRVLARIIIERDGGQQTGNGGGRGDSPGEWIRVQIGGEHVKEMLGEREPGAGGNVGAVDDEVRAVVGGQNLKPGVLEQDLVVILCRQIRPAIGGGPESRPMHRIKHLAQQRQINIPLQKRRLEKVENLVAIEAVGGGGNAAAGNRRNHIHFVQQAVLGP